MYFHLSSQGKQPAALPCPASSPAPRPPGVLHTESLLWKAAWICLDNTFILQRLGQQSACLGKAHRSALLNPWTLKPYRNLSQVPACKTTSDQSRANKAGQWEDEGAEMGSGSSCRGLAWLPGDAEPSLLHHILQQLQPQSQAGLGLGVIAPLTAFDSPEVPWIGIDTLWSALIYKGNHFPP